MRELWQLSASELAVRIARAEVSSVEAVAAHIARIEAVDGDLNAVVCRRFEEALGEARAADERGAGKDPGALHGVPMTVKDELDLVGTPSTFGIPSRLHDRPERDGTHVARLRNAGAIVLGKTNVPQLMIYIESDNPLYGRTNNPWNLERTCGGSSGGEAAIIAAGGSPLGLGSDLGGSLRAPAAFCGIVSLKPTSGRLEGTARVPWFAGQRAIVSEEGPLARTVADVALALEIANGGRDPDVLPPRPLRDPKAVKIRKLRVGYYEHAGSFRAAPALARAAREAAELLEELGARVVPFDPPRVDDAMDLFFGILSADGGQAAKELLGSNPRDPRVAELLSTVSRSRRTLGAIEQLLALTGQASLRRIVRNYGFTGTAHYYRLVEAQRAYQHLFAVAMDAAAGGPLDLLVCPPIGLPALLHGESANVLTAGAYAPLYNLLGYPAGTLPFTCVGEDEQRGRGRSLDRVENAAHRCERDSAGLPAGVQIAGRPWREDVVLAAMFALEDVVREHDDFPHTPHTPATPAAL